jgi:hypothetical protein
MECVNLKKVFGSRFKVTWEESYFAEHGRSARADDPWLQIIPCQHGHIYPYGGDMLVASTAKPGRVARALIQLDCTKLWRDGDDGVDVLFDVDDFEPVAEQMKPRRRRRLSPERRAKLVAAGKRYQKRPEQAGVHTPSEGLERTMLGVVESTAV